MVHYSVHCSRHQTSSSHGTQNRNVGLHDAEPVCVYLLAGQASRRRMPYSGLRGPTSDHFRGQYLLLITAPPPVGAGSQGIVVQHLCMGFISGRTEGGVVINAIGNIISTNPPPLRCRGSNKLRKRDKMKCNEASLFSARCRSCAQYLVKGQTRNAS
jgi:hypothetical protein